MLLPLASGLPADTAFTTAQALEAGVRHRQLAQLVHAGALRRPLKGVYVPAQLPDRLELRIAALSLAMPPDAFATDHTAAWLHAGDDVLPPNSDLQAPAPSFFLPGGRGRLRNESCRSGHRMVRDEDLADLGGIRATTALRTAMDLGRLQSADLALWGMDRLMAVGGFELAELVGQVARFKGYRGVLQLRSMAPWVDAGSESFGESALRWRWIVAGLPRPETQISIREGGVEVARIDLGLPELLFGAEYDGAEWHGADVTERDESRRARLWREYGYEIVVCRAPMVFGGKQNAEVLLRRGFDEAREHLARKRRFLTRER